MCDLPEEDLAEYLLWRERAAARPPERATSRTPAAETSRTRASEQLLAEVEA